MAVLAIDVGNTNVVFGIFDANNLAQFRSKTDSQRTSDEWMVLISAFMKESDYAIEEFDGVIIGSVVAPVAEAITRALKERFDITPVIVSAEINGGIDIRIDNPKEAGADRIANTVAAFDSLGGPAIVVDLGTATTLDVVAEDGAYLGGIIMPGIEISMDALYAKADALKRVPLAIPDKLIGTSTIGAIQSGVTYGYAAQVDGLIEQVEKELGPCHVVATGGLSGLIVPLSQRIQSHDRTLTLRGLKLIYDRQL